MKKIFFLIITILFVIIGNSFAQYDMDYMQLMDIGYYQSVTVSSLDIDGEFFCLGESYQSYNGYDYVGEADIWKLNTDGFWEQIATLHANDYAEDDHFGNDVKISGDYVYVAAKEEDADGYSSAGSVYVFKNDGNDNFTQIAKILNPFPASYDRFGWAIDVQEDYLVVGCYGDDGTYDDEGSAYVFKKDASDNFSYIATLKGDLGAQYYFGISVAINGNYIVVGACYEDPAGVSNAGSAYVFKNDGSDNFSRVAKLLASDAEEEDRFGNSVDVEGNYVVVGAYTEDAGGVSGAGSVYVYKNDGSDNFTQIVKLHEDPFIGGSGFGEDVQISNDTIYVTSQNATYIFKNNGSDVYNYIYKLESLGDDYIELFSYQDKKLIVSERYSNSRYIKFFYFDNPEVVQSPSDKDNLCGDASLFMQAQSRFAKEYQWQISTDGGNNYTDLSDDAIYYGTTGKTLGINYNNSLQGNFYRCKFINPYGTSYSDAATLLQETEPPVLTCQNYTLYLDNTGNATLKASDVVTSASDNCGLGDTTLSQTVFDCSNTGTNTVTVTLTDVNSNSTQQDITVTVADTISPTVSALSDQTVSADDNCEAILSDYTSSVTASDNCTASDDLTITQNPSAGTTISGNTNAVSVTVADENGNSKTIHFNVSVEDNTAPVLSSHDDVTLSITSNCEGTLGDYTSDITATDNCTSSLTVVQSPVAGTTVNGAQEVTLSAVDDAGNTAEITFNAVVEDNENPVLTVQNISVTLDATGNASITPADVVTSATDNCVLSDTTLSQSTFTSSDLGTVNVTVTLLDAAGNSATATSVVTVNEHTSISTVETNGISVYPNPSTGVFTIDLSNTNAESLQIIDVTGKVVLQQDVNTTATTVDLTGFANGIYTLKIQTTEGVEVMKIVKQ